MINFKAQNSFSPMVSIKKTKENLSLTRAKTTDKKFRNFANTN